MPKHRLKKRSRTAQRKSVSRFTEEAGRRGWYSPTQWAELEEICKKWKAEAEKSRADVAERILWEAAAKASMQRALITRPDDVAGRIAVHAAFAGFCGLAPDDVGEPVDFVESLNAPQLEEPK